MAESPEYLQGRADGLAIPYSPECVGKGRSTESNNNRALTMRLASPSTTIGRNALLGQ